MDATLLEQFKENIVPLPQGRNALKTGAAYKMAKPQAALAVQEFEKRLKNEDLDDPLEVYTEYIQWLHAAHPLGSLAENNLLDVLERCTLMLRDVPFYKNDPRYLKVWLDYAGYSDLPRDIFVYLARKGIGSQLALYYEEFARFLEHERAHDEARQVYEIGIERQAAPLERLRRLLRHFAQRVPDAGRAPESAPPPKRAKLQVYADTASVNLRDTVFSSQEMNPLPTLAQQRKENTVPAKTWVGEKYVLQSQPKAHAAFKVFCDRPAFDIVKEGGTCYTLFTRPDKPVEKLQLNMRLLYPSEDEEYCPQEVYLLSQRLGAEKSHTFTIPLAADESVAPQLPTITAFSRLASNEVVQMFNAGGSAPSDDEGAEATNYDGFVTETGFKQTP